MFHIGILYFTLYLHLYFHLKKEQILQNLDKRSYFPLFILCLCLCLCVCVCVCGWVGVWVCVRAYVCG